MSSWNIARSEGTGRLQEELPRPDPSRAVTIRHAFVEPPLSTVLLGEADRAAVGRLMSEHPARAIAALPDDQVLAYLPRASPDRVRRAARTVAGQKPPMVRILGKTRGWAVGSRLKVYLTLVGRAHRHPTNHTVNWTKEMRREVQHLTGTNRRTLNRALQDLRTLGFIETPTHARRARKDSLTDDDVWVREFTGDITVLQDSGAREPLTRPANGEFFSVSDRLWEPLRKQDSEPLMAMLSGSGLAVLLVLLRRIRREDPQAPIWVASSQIATWYGFSAAAWRRGALELCQLGIFYRSEVTAEGPRRIEEEQRISGGTRYDDLLFPYPVEPDPTAIERRAKPPEGAVTYTPTVVSARLSATAYIAGRTRRLAYVAEAPKDSHIQLHRLREALAYIRRHHEAARRGDEDLITTAEAYVELSKRLPRTSSNRTNPGYEELITAHRRKGDYKRAIALAQTARDEEWVKRGKGTWDQLIESLQQQRQRLADRAAGQHSRRMVEATDDLSVQLQHAIGTPATSPPRDVDEAFETEETSDDPVDGIPFDGIF